MNSAVQSEVQARLAKPAISLSLITPRDDWKFLAELLRVASRNLRDWLCAQYEQHCNSDDQACQKPVDAGHADSPLFEGKVTIGVFLRRIQAHHP
jgi:hypothetical protein